MRKGFRFAPLSFAVLSLILTACPSAGGGGGTGSAPQITSFTANPESITAPGQAVALSWTVTNGVTGLEIDQGVGAVSGTSQVVYPTAATTYTLTATNSSGETSKSVDVGLGTGPGTGPGVEDGLPPSGTFGVSLTQGDFQSDQSGSIADASDPRIIRVQPGGTFYALVSYSDPGGITGATIYIANSSPPGLEADLVQGQDVGGFTLNGEVSGCVLDGTQTSVTCIYEIAVGSIPNITELPGVSGEFAYVFRTRVRDAADHESKSPPRGYVIVGDSGGTPTPPGNPNPPGNPDPPGNPNPPANRAPNADFTFDQQDGTLAVAFSGASSSDPDGDLLKYAWTFGDGTTATSRDFRKIYRGADDYTVSLKVTDPDSASDTETKTVTVEPVDGGGGGGPTPTNYALTVTKPMNGTVVSDPVGINCGTDCTQNYASGTKVKLNATPANGYKFDAWGGACSGTTCEVTMNAAKTVTATFSAVSTTPATYALTVTKSGNGVVKSNPAGIDCGSDCTQDYDSGTPVMLTATPGSGFKFDGWNGDCSGTTCQVTMSAARNVSAAFSATTQDLNAEAGPASKPGTVRTSVTLDGRNSTGATSYNWALTERPSGSSATVSGVTRALASFTPDVAGKYIATLTVGNGTETDPDSITINVSAASLPTPDADAGDDRETTVNVPTPLPLDGTDSKNAASFNWQVTKLEPGSTPTLATPKASTTTFTADVAGTYTVTLTVSDSNGKQPDKDTVEIEVNP